MTVTDSGILSDFNPYPSGKIDGPGLSGYKVAGTIILHKNCLAS